MGRSLIVNADDFGLTPGVNFGILEAHQRGIVRSTTLMVNTPGYTDAVARARAFPGLAVGLHLNITQGRPLLPPAQVSSLVDGGGAFYYDPARVTRDGQLEEIRAEFHAQVQKFLSTGLRLSHLDSHHHLHRSERILDVVAELARELGVTVRAFGTEALLVRQVEPKALCMDVFGAPTGATGLVKIIESLPDGVTEIPCHPGFVDAHLPYWSSYSTQRELELAAVTNPEVIRTVQAQGVLLTNYILLAEGR